MEPGKAVPSGLGVVGSPWLPEHLLPVPGHVLRGGPLIRVLGGPNARSVISQEPIVQRSSSHSVPGGNQDDPGARGGGGIRHESERPPIEETMMGRAERQAVVGYVRPVHLLPTDVSRIQPHRGMPEAKVEITHGAAVLPGEQDPLPEGGIAGL